MTGQRRKLEAALQAARATVELLEAELADAETGPAGDPLLSARQALEKFGIGHEGLRAAVERGELTVSRGARGKLLVAESELRRYISARPYHPAPRRAQGVESLDAWETQANLRLVGRK